MTFDYSHAEALYKVQIDRPLRRSAIMAFALVQLYCIYTLTYGFNACMPLGDWESTGAQTYNLSWIVLGAVSLVAMLSECFDCDCQCAMMPDVEFKLALIFSAFIWILALVGSHPCYTGEGKHQDVDDEDYLLHELCLLVMLGTCTHLRFRWFLLPCLSAVVSYPVRALVRVDEGRYPAQHAANVLCLVSTVISSCVGLRWSEWLGRQCLLHQVENEARSLSLRQERDAYRRQSAELNKLKCTQKNIFKEVEGASAKRRECKRRHSFNGGVKKSISIDSNSSKDRKRHVTDPGIVPPSLLSEDFLSDASKPVPMTVSTEERSACSQVSTNLEIQVMQLPNLHLSEALSADAATDWGIVEEVVTR